MTAGDAWAALLLGVVEGLTEFLPVSSTGHLIVAADLLGRDDPATDRFIVVIQLGAILAVCWHFRKRIFAMLAAPGESGTLQFALRLLLAFLPAAIVGLLFHDLIKEHLFSPLTVAGALIVGGIAIIAIENLSVPTRVDSMDAMNNRTALLIGCVQVLALFPGVSRAGATIMGGRLLGLSRPAATEFSFFLAIPVMFAASSFDLLQGWGTLERGDGYFIAIGFVAAFASAMVAVRWLLAYVATRDFKPFGWYRIVFGSAIAALALYSG